MLSLLEQLNAVFEKHSDIYEVGLIYPTSEDTDEQWIVCEEGKLGVSVKHLKRLYWEASDVFWNLRSSFMAGDCDSVSLLLSATRGMLLVNGDHATAWNTRKTAVLRGHSSPQQELSFLDLLFSKHSKSSHAWSHRRWCWQQIAPHNEVCSSADAGATRTHLCQLIKEELKSCAVVASHFPKNYFAWAHRIWMLQRYLPHITQDEAVTVLEEELSFSAEWLAGHVSDHCATHHRAQVVAMAMASSPTHESKAGVANEELKFIGNLLIRYPGHESLWLCWRRAAQVAATLLIEGARYGQEWREIVAMFTDEVTTTSGSTGTTSVSDMDSSSLLSDIDDLSTCLLSIARSLVQRIKDTSAWDYPIQRRLALTSLRHLTYTIGLNISGIAVDKNVSRPTATTKEQNRVVVSCVQELNRMAGDMIGPIILPCGAPYPIG